MGEAKRRRLLDPNYGKAQSPSLKIELCDFLTDAGMYELICENSRQQIEVAYEPSKLILLRKVVLNLLTIYPIHSFTVCNWNKWLKQHSARLHIEPSISFEVLEADETLAAKNRIDNFRETHNLKDKDCLSILNSESWFLNCFESTECVGRFDECLTNYFEEYANKPFDIESFQEDSNLDLIANSGRFYINEDPNTRVVFHPELVTQYRQKLIGC